MELCHAPLTHHTEENTAWGTPNKKKCLPGPDCEARKSQIDANMQKDVLQNNWGGSFKKEKREKKKKKEREKKWKKPKSLGTCSTYREN